MKLLEPFINSILIYNINNSRNYLPAICFAKSCSKMYCLSGFKKFVFLFYASSTQIELALGIKNFSNFLRKDAFTQKLFGSWLNE